MCTGSQVNSQARWQTACRAYNKMNELMLFCQPCHAYGKKHHVKKVIANKVKYLFSQVFKALRNIENIGAFVGRKSVIFYDAAGINQRYVHLAPAVFFEGMRRVSHDGDDDDMGWWRPCEGNRQQFIAQASVKGANKDAKS